jgi:hypothetical protein
VDRLRFWLDVVYVLAYDLVGIVLRPARRQKIEHALGIGLGAIDCLISSPHYDEPPARREYNVVLNGLAASDSQKGVLAGG